MFAGGDGPAIAPTIGGLQAGYQGPGGSSGMVQQQLRHALVRIANATIADIGTPGRARFSGGDMYQRM